MKSIFKIAISFLAIYMVVSLYVPAAASFWIKGAAFRYSPDYGDLEENLSERIPYYETPRFLGPDTGTAFSAGYDFSESWGLRLDAFRSVGTADYHHKRLADRFTFQTSTSALIVSTVYRFSIHNRVRPYLGAGLGVFSSELVVQSNIDEGAQWRDSPLSYQLLAGADLELQEGLFFSVQAAYLSAKAHYGDYRCLEDCSTDWSGVFVSIGIGYRFGPLKIGVSH